MTDKLIKNSARCLLICLCLSLLCGCITRPPKVVWPQVPYATRMQQLRQLGSWQLRGSLTLSQEGAHQHMNVHWRHAGPQQDVLNFIAPLGLRSARLVITPEGAELISSGQPTLHDASAEALVAHHFGHAWPVRHLLAWVRGMPVHGLPAQITQNHYHHITQLKQADWTIQYKNYQQVGALALPGHITLRYHNPQQNDLVLTLKVHAWQLDTIKK